MLPLRRGDEVFGFFYVVNFDVEKADETKDLLEIMAFFIATEIFNNQLVLVCPSEFYGNLHFASEAFVTIWENAVECQVLIACLERFKHLCVKSCRTTMQCVWCIVDGELILFPVQGELALCDAVAKSTN